jgi:3-methyl-2-oxobutanoate hydroxymethyltransferase
VLVLHDMLGVTRGDPFRFVRNFMDGSASIELAVRQYVTDVKSGRFPDDKMHSF